MNESESPPGGWKWRHPRTGRITARDSFPEILEGAQRTLLNLGEDPALAVHQIHQATAASLIRQGREDLVQVVKEVHREAGQYAAGAKAAFLKWWRESPIFGLIKGKVARGEAVFVPLDVANDRARICAKCPQNVIPTGKGWLQNWTDGQMLKSVEGRITESHDHLGVCDVCSCELRAAVWWQPDIIATTTRGAKFARNLPAHCWKRKIIQSSTSEWSSR